ncbi:TetR/AcrR family transcriptional regulator [Novosphingobium aerophilum]|uniref:TetR/AcrR family transcriptional regulator n=1 Tax=Novosphingobium TaxID=165696 RepID=UPI000A5C81BD|nr:MULTISPECIES: TetR/AcrR family transcriptional regulator [unclassified Novosphingobium]TCM42139.1 AcrR family transcriptional regulator [Novosphingobium sp. ST904]WRT91409.1 TetR/AcrR family transcriptional regulator [Novosphingobium sp. RL4]
MPVSEGGQEQGIIALPPRLAAAVTDASAAVSHNLHGQKLGRKGRITRERILAATIELVENSDEPVTLGAVARAVGLGMTSLYNYFTDLTELLLAVLEPVMGTAQEDYFALVRPYWADDELGPASMTFVRSYHDFWSRHTGLLHLRNSMADQFDIRIMHQRVNSTRPLIGLMVAQMDPRGVLGDTAVLMATTLMTGIERSITLATDRRLHRVLGTLPGRREESLLEINARLIELAIRDTRERARAEG